jgi:hypothetical protein
LDYLRKFGIDRTQLATRASTNAYAGKEDLGIRRLLGTRGWTDKRTHKSVQDISEQGIFFVRRIDGVNMDGITHGGVFIGFGEHGKIAELKITWRGLEPFELQQTLTSAQIVAEIRQGLAKWGPNPPTGPIKRITVFGFEPFYRGQPGDADLEKQQRFVEPYVMICGSLGDGSTNDVKCFSEMPIFLKKRN